MEAGRRCHRPQRNFWKRPPQCGRSGPSPAKPYEAGYRIIRVSHSRNLCFIRRSCRAALILLALLGFFPPQRGQAQRYISGTVVDARNLPVAVRRLSAVRPNFWAPRQLTAASPCPQDQAGCRYPLPTLSPHRSTSRPSPVTCSWSTTRNRLTHRLPLASRLGSTPASTRTLTAQRFVKLPDFARHKLRQRRL